MPECPECKGEIKLLVIVTCTYVADIVRLENGNLVTLDNPEERDSELVHYECPSCDEMLFTKTSDAKRFLSNKEDYNNE